MIWLPLGVVLIFAVVLTGAAWLARQDRETIREREREIAYLRERIEATERPRE